MIIFLYGSDDYRREARKRAIIAEFVKRHSSLGVDRFDFEEPDAHARLDEFTKNQSMFDPVKLAVVSGFFESLPDRGLPLLQSFLLRKDITLLLVERDKPLKQFNFLLKKPSFAEEFGTLTGASWRKFLMDEARARGASLEKEAFEFLASAYEGESFRCVTELEKLRFLGKKIITRQDLIAFGIERAPEFWATLQGFARGNMRERFSTLERFFASHEPAAKVFNVLAYQSQEITDACATYDVLIKSGKLDYEEALVDFAMR